MARHHPLRPGQDAVLTAGIALVRHGTILLVHATGAAPKKDWSIPKGHVDPGEAILTAAIRETREESSIDVPRRFLRSLPLSTTRRTRKKGKRVSATLYFWVVDVSDWDLPNRLPEDWLQLEEVDVAGFIPRKQAKKLVPGWMRSVIDQVPR